MLQRMGRTGRKRAGRVVLLLMKGKEEASFGKANDNYEKMQRMISDGKMFKFHSELSARIMPKDVRPEVDKRNVEIPIENTQDPSLPEPHRRPKKKTKMPKKRFNMPDDVETAFQPLSKLFGAQASKAAKPKKPVNPELDPANLAVRPPLERVLLDELEESLLKDRYQTIAGDEDFEIEGGMPRMDKWPEYQRDLRPTGRINHGAASKRLVKMIKAMTSVNEHTERGWKLSSQMAAPLNPPEYGDENEVPKNRGGGQEDDSDASTIAIDDLEETTAREAPRKRATNGASSRRSIDKPSKPRANPASKRKRTTRGTSIDLEASSEDGEDSRNKDDEVDSDLDDFVVPDDAPSPSYLPSSAAPRSSLAASISAKAEKWKEVVKDPKPATSRTARFFEPTEFAGTQGTEGDDDMPEIGTLLSKRKVRGSSDKENSAPEAEKQVKHIAILGLSNDDYSASEQEEEEEVVAKEKRKTRPVLSDSEEEVMATKKRKSRPDRKSTRLNSSHWE